MGQKVPQKGKHLFKRSHREERNIPQELQKSGSQVNSIIAAQRLNDIIGMILDGRPREEIFSYITTKYDVNKSMADNLIVDAHQEIFKQEQIELDDIITSHVERYEELYTKLIELKAERIAMEALKGKEKLIQLHKNGTHMRVVSGQVSSVTMVGAKTYYDPKRLTQEQSERLDQLLNKIDSKNSEE